MNRKGFSNALGIALVVVIIASIAGYFVFVKTSKLKSDSSAQQLVPIGSQQNSNSKPFVKIREDEESVYYEGYVSASGTYSRSVEGFVFELDPDQNNLFPGLKARDFADSRKGFYIQPVKEALRLLPQKTKLSYEAKKGAPCAVAGKATVIILSYRAAKDLVPGNFNEATIKEVLSSTEEKYSYWEQRENTQEEILDCTGVTP